MDSEAKSGVRTASQARIKSSQHHSSKGSCADGGCCKQGSLLLEQLGSSPEVPPAPNPGNSIPFQDWEILFLLLQTFFKFVLGQLITNLMCGMRTSLGTRKALNNRRELRAWVSTAEHAPGLWLGLFEKPKISSVNQFLSQSPHHNYSEGLAFRFPKSKMKAPMATQFSSSNKRIQQDEHLDANKFKNEFIICELST